MKIAITTPTGHIGSGLTERLLQDGNHELVLLCRDATKVKQYTDKSATAAQGDQADADYVVKATEGADVLFWLTPPKMDSEDFRAYQNAMGDNAANAVRANKIKRVVHLSSFGAQHADGTGPIAGLHDIEKKLNAAANEIGGSVTHLRPASFYENLFMAVPTIKSDGAMFMPVPGDIPFSMIATRDISKAAYEVVTDESWSGVNVRELLGPQDYSLNEAAKIIGDAAGKPVNFVQVPADAARQAFQGMGASENVAGKYIEMYEAIPKGLIKSEQPRDASSTTPTRLEDFAKQAIAPAINA